MSDPSHLTRQYRLLRAALMERGVSADEVERDASIDHLPGRCRFRDHEWSVVYPRWLMLLVDEMPRPPAIYRRSFVGYYVPKRRCLVDEIGPRDYICFTPYGRDPETPLFDRRYYEVMLASESVICSTSLVLDDPALPLWTYRLMETVMAMREPVLEAVDVESLSRHQEWAGLITGTAAERRAEFERWHLIPEDWTP